MLGGCLNTTLSSVWVTGSRLPARMKNGTPDQIHLDMEFADEGGEGPAPYEVLLLAAMKGDSSHFTRQDGIEEAWRIMQPLLDAPPPEHTYAPGSWGPAEADRLTNGFGGWHPPWVVAS